MLSRLLLILACVATPAISDVRQALDAHILPGQQRLAETTEALARQSETQCDPHSVQPAFHDAYDAWIGIEHIRFGPVEDLGLGIAMSFWPDPKDRTGKALARLMADEDEIVDDPARFPEVSAAAQGFTALERLLYEDQTNAAYACRLTRAIARGLADKADAINAAWPAFALLMTTAGADGNLRFQSEAEAKRALYTALTSGLEFLHDQRLGRSLGTFDRPRPLRAEAWRSARSLRHVATSLKALEDLATAFFDGAMPQTMAAFDAARARAAAIDDPAFAGVADPITRIRVEALQQAVQDIRAAVSTEIGETLGISAGFNALDGD